MAPPELDWGDAGETQLAAWTAGLSHPTGYPLFLMLGWLWTHLLALFGVVPTRAMTLFSVSAGAASVAAIMPMMLALFRRARLNLSTTWSLFIATSSAIFFGLSHTFWSQALLAEVYTFHLLLLVLLLWGLWGTGEVGDPVNNEASHLLSAAGTDGDTPVEELMASDLPASAPLPLSPSRAWALYGLALLYGIALSHHRTMILWAPGLLLWLWLEEREAFRVRRLLTLVGLVALPQLFYLYIAWRGAVTAYLHQPLANGETLTLYDGTLRTFVDHILGTVYAHNLGLKEPLAERVAGVIQLARKNVIPSVLLSFLTISTALFGWSNKQKPAFLPLSDRLLLLCGGLITLLFGIIYAIADVEVMFLPTWLVVTILTFSGVALWVSNLSAKWERFRWVPLLIGVLLIFLIGEQVRTRIPHSRADHTAPRRLVKELFSANPPQNAILVTNDRNEMVPVWYAQFAEGQRRDILALFPLITPAPEHSHVSEVVKWALQWERPVLLTKPMAGLGLLYEMEPYANSLVTVHGAAIMPTEPVLQSDLAPELSVLSWAPSATEIVAGDRVTLSIGLQANTPIAHNLSFSLQLFRANGEGITQEDIAPDPFLPSSEWPVDVPLRLHIPITIPADSAPGECEWRLSTYVLKDDGFESIGQQIPIAKFVLQ